MGGGETGCSAQTSRKECTNVLQSSTLIYLIQSLLVKACVSNF